MRGSIGATVAAILLLVAFAAPATAAKCDHVVRGDTINFWVVSGQTVCAHDDGAIVYGVSQGGTFIGGAGFDMVDGPMAGKFFGHGGTDLVRILAGTFVGGHGNDEVWLVGDPATFIGGPGDDRVDTLSGTFIGSAGSDRVDVACVGDFTYRAVEHATGSGC